MALTTAEATRQAISAQWALNQLGSKDYYNLCQRFIEQAYGTGGQYASAAAAGKSLVKTANPDEADVGDLVFFRPDASNGYAGHAAIYIGNGEMVGATNAGVTKDNIFTSPYWKNLLVGFGDPPPQWRGRNADGDMLQGAANLVAKGKTAVGDTAGASRARSVESWGGAGQWSQQIIAAAQKYDIPVNLLAAKVNVESGGNMTARSGAGAQGLLQLMPDTARSLGVTNPNDPVQNLDAGAKYFRQQYDRFGNWDDALRAYNAGPNGNWNNPETIGHVKKVGQWADTIGNTIGAGGGGGMPTAPGGGGGDRKPGDPLRPPPWTSEKNLEGAWAGFWQKLEEMNRAAQEGTRSRSEEAARNARAAQDKDRARQGLPPLPVRAAPPAPSTALPAPGQLADDTGAIIPAAPGTNPVTGTVTPPGAPGAGGPGAVRRPQGWVDPASVTNPAYMSIIGAWNNALERQQAAQDAVKNAKTEDERLDAADALAAADEGVFKLAPQAANIIEAAQKEAGGQFVPGTSTSDKKFTIVKRNPQTGTWETQIIDNPAWEESDALQAQKLQGDYGLQRGRESDAAMLARQREELAGRAGISGAEAASRERISGSEIASRERLGGAEIASREGIANLNATTSRVTTALSAAVQQRSQDIEAQIRQGDLSLREGTEQFNQWYKQNVEAPLAILQQQRETERYKIEQQNAVTQRATGQAEHERGVAQIGQQMWGQAAQAYNQMIPLTVGDQWGQGFQQNLAAGGGQYTPNQGATFNVPEDLDAFATRKVAEMLKGVSPYAASIAGAEGQIGAPGQAMSGQQMTGLQQQATGVASNALANPFQMQPLPQMQMPGQVDIAGLAGAGMPNGQLTEELDQYIPQFGS